MKNILAIGSINMDSVVGVDHIPKLGETILSNSIENFHGGKGANQAVAIGRLGGGVNFLGKLGKDSNGKELAQALEESNVGTKYLLFDEKKLSGSAFIYVDKDGNNCIVVNPAANGSLCPEDIDAQLEAFKDVDYCVLQLEIPMNTVKHAIDICAEKKITVILNPAPAQELSCELLSKVDFLVPNESELELITGRTINTLEDVKDSMNILINMGVKNVITTLGDKGVMYGKGNEFIHFDAVKVNAVDTTAAGDSFIGGFVYSLCNGQTVERAIEYATYVGALTVSKKGAQSSLPYGEEVEKFMDIIK